MVEEILINVLKHTFPFSVGLFKATLDNGFYQSACREIATVRSDSQEPACRVSLLNVCGIELNTLKLSEPANNQK